MSDMTNPAGIDHLLDVLSIRLGVERDVITVLTSRPGRAVCSASTPRGRVVAKISTTPHEFDREAVALERLAGLGLPVGRVIDLVGGPPAILVAGFVEGLPVAADSSPTTLTTVGALLRRVHRVPAGAPYSGHPTIDQWVTTWARDLAGWWRGRDDAPPAVAERTDQWLGAIRPALASRTGALILFDGRPEHFIVDAGGAVSMIDVADLMPGDPLMDLAVFELFAPGSREWLYAGYQPTESELAAADVLLPFYQYLRHLAGAEWKLRIGHDDASAGWHLARAQSLLQRHAPEG